MPLKWNSKTREPYLDVYCASSKGVETHIRITPPRIISDDISINVDILTSPLVYPNVTAPHPYVAQDAVDFFTMTKKVTDEVIEKEMLPKLSISLFSGSEVVGVDQDQEDEAANVVLTDADRFILSSTPIKVIRHVKEDGTDAFIGDVSIFRNLYRDIPDEKEKERVKTENDEKKPGDPSILWCIGCKSTSPRASVSIISVPLCIDFGFLDLLHPDYHGRSIMTTAVQTMLREVWVPYLKVRHIVGDAFIDNLGSQKVFLKNGFRFIGHKNALTDMSHKGRADCRLAEFEWKYGEPEDEHREK